jgi:hypothetical protein
MTNITKNTCATCINFDNIGEGLQCLNLVYFEDQGLAKFRSRSARATDSCPDHEQRVVRLYNHPDNDSQISLERVNSEGFEHGVLIATDEDGKTVRVPIGQIGLIEVGLDLARIGKNMVSTLRF